MSGASSLAAAKRRRAAPDVKPLTGPTSPSNPIDSNPVPSLVQGPVNPLIVLVKHDKQILDLENRISNIKIEKATPLSNEDIAHFKTQYNSLVEEIQELKKIIIKVQTFSMEMNIELLNIKRLLKNDARVSEVSEIENDIKPAE
jgi:hypothetical protein